MASETFNPVYHVGHTFSRTLFNYYFRLESTGALNVPTHGPCLIASNHISYLDPFLIGAPLKRQLFFFARNTLFKPGLSSWILKRFNCIPVDPKGDSGYAAFKQVFSVLNKGGSLTLFPEGTRSRDGQIRPAKRGVGLMACKTQVPVVPVRIFGSFEAWRPEAKYPDIHQDVSIAYGKMLLPEDYDVGKKDPNRYQIAADRILEAIKALKDPTDKHI